MADTHLHETDARAAALAWYTELRNRVRLHLDDPHEVSFPRSYEWIEINLDVERKYKEMIWSRQLEPYSIDTVWTPRVDSLEQAHTARAAALVWLMVSCCPGYGCLENPTFWRTVFEKFRATESKSLIYDKPAPEEPDEVQPDVPVAASGARAFPRFKLRFNDCTSQSHAAARVLSGQQTFIDSTCEERLSQIVQRLSKFIDQHRWNRAILEFAVCPNRFQLGALSAFVENVPKISTSHYNFIQVHGLHAPTAHFFGIYINHVIPRDFEDDQRGEIFETSDVFVRKLVLSSPLRRAELAEWLWTALRVSCGPVSRSFGGLRTIEVRSNNLTADNVSAVLSALPSARSVKTVRFNRHLCAIYFTRRISIPRGNLELLDIDETTPVDAFFSMQHGNNLLNVIQGKTPASSAYYSCRLRLGTTLYSEPAVSSDVVVNLHTESILDLCVDSSDRSTYDNWAATVVPGMGLGWVQVTAIVEVFQRPSSPCKLRRVVIDTPRNERLVQWLRAMQDSPHEALEYLELERRRKYW